MALLTRWSVVATCSLVYLTISLASVGVVACLPFFSGDLRVSLSDASSLIVAYSIGFAFGGPALGWWQETKNTGDALIVYLFLFVVAAGFWLAADSYEVSVAIRFVLGVFGGVVASLAVPIAVGVSRPEHSGRIIAIVNLGMVGASIIGVPLVAAGAENVGWRFFPALLVALGGGCLILLLKQDVRSSGVAALLYGGSRATNNSDVIPFYLITGLQSAGQYALFAFSYAYTVEKLGLSSDLVKLGLMLFGSGAAVGAIISGVLIDRGSALQVILRGLFANIFAICLLFVAGSHAIVALLVLFLLGLTSLLVPPAVQKSLSVDGRRRNSLFLAWNSSAAYSGIAFGTYMGGRVLEWFGLHALPYAAITLVAAALMIAAWLTRYPLTPSPPQ